MREGKGEGPGRGRWGGTQPPPASSKVARAGGCPARGRRRGHPPTTSAPLAIGGRGAPRAGASLPWLLLLGAPCWGAPPLSSSGDATRGDGEGAAGRRPVLWGAGVEHRWGRGVRAGWSHARAPPLAEAVSSYAFKAVLGHAVAVGCHRAMAAAGSRLARSRSLSAPRQQAGWARWCCTPWPPAWRLKRVYKHLTFRPACWPRSQPRPGVGPRRGFAAAPVEAFVDGAQSSLQRFRPS